MSGSGISDMQDEFGVALSLPSQLAHTRSRHICAKERADRRMDFIHLHACFLDREGATRVMSCLQHALRTRLEEEGARMQAEAMQAAHNATQAAEKAMKAAEREQEEAQGRCAGSAETARAVLRELAAYDIAEARHASLVASLRIQEVLADVWEDFADALDAIHVPDLTQTREDADTTV
jgi:hypothetical protein